MVVVVVVVIIVGALLVVYIKIWSINVHLGLPKADVEFVWWVGLVVVGFRQSFLCPTQLQC